MKRRLKWGLLIGALLLAVLFFLPHRFVRDTDSIAINWVVYGGYGGENLALTQEQTEALQELICSAYVVRTGGYHTSGAEPLVEISFRADGQPGHLELGEADFMYHSAGAWQFFNILQGEQFQREVLSILEK